MRAMEPNEPFLSLALAAAAGFLIGLERERSRPSGPGESFLGGARTHPLVALVGGISMLVAREAGLVAIAVPFGALVVLLAMAYAGDVARDRQAGITSEAAFLVSFLLGMLALTERVVTPVSTKALAVSALAVLTAFLLSAKPTLHPLVRRVSAEDVGATLKFLILAVVVVPLLPDRTVGPLDVVNPLQLGWLVVLISGLSFAGYAAIRLLGPERGLGLTGLLGGLVSSTAVTLSMAGRAKERPELAAPAALAATLASTVMFLRVLVVVAVVSPSLEARLAWPMAAGALGGAASALVLWLRSRRQERPASAVRFSNPFELGSALRLTLLFAAVLVGAKAATDHLGSLGTYAAGVLAGATDVDAITLSMAKLAGGEVTPAVAVTTIFLATASNTLVKGVMAWVSGGAPFGRRVLAAQVVSLAAGAVGLALSALR
jgi:uncharacterized membrane protein (DUF4010 family)